MVAVVAVFVNHLVGHPRGAFTGVDVFFVISGYLITGLLVRDAGQVGVRRFFAGFYARRARRILPAALTVLAVSWAAAGLTFTGARVRDAHTDIGWSLGFLANVHSARLGTDYFAQGRAPSITQHFWSLAVEEQFYLAWPVVVLLVVAVAGRRGRNPSGALLGVISVLTVASFLYALRDSTDSPTTAYFSTFARAWELGVGAVLAVLLARFPRSPNRLGPARGPLALAGVSAIVAGFFLVSPTRGFPAPWAALPVLATAVVLAVSASAGAWTWVLTNRASVYLGEISYSLYLWHWPTIIVVSALLPQRTALYYVIVVAAAVALSVFSFEFVETPLRTRRQNRFEGEPRPRKATALVAAGLAVVSFAAYTLKPEPTQPHFVADGTSAQVTQSTDGTSLYRPSAAVQAGLIMALKATRFPALNPSLDHLGLSAAFRDWQGCLSTATLLPTCVYRPTKANGKRVLVYGDSIALSYLPGIRRALTAQGWTVYGYARTQCAAADVQPSRQGETAEAVAGCRKHHAALATVADQVKPDLVVLTSAETTIGTLASRATGAAAVAEYHAGLRASVTAVNKPGRQVVILSPPPIAKSLLSCDTAAGGPADCVGSISDAWLEQSGADSDVARQTGTRYADTRLLTCSTAAFCPAFVGTTPIMYDGGHMTRQYAIGLAAELGAVLLNRPAPGR